jgi:hypothetical protein
MRPLLAVLAITLATVALRLWGIDHLLPHGWQTDNQMAFQAALLREGASQPDGELRDVQYPDLLPSLVARLSGPAPRPDASDPLAEHLDAAGFDIRAMRIGIALISSLLVPLTYLLARRFLAAGWSLFATALIATSLLLQTFAQQARPHAAAASVFLLAVLCCMRLARRPTWWNHALAALAAVLAIGALHSGLAVLMPLAAAWLVGPLGAVSSARGRWARWLVAPPVLAAVVAAAFLAFYPFALRDGPATERGRPAIEGTALVWANHRVDLRDLDGRGFATVVDGLWNYEPVLLVLVVATLASLLALRSRAQQTRERRADAFVAGAYVLAYLIVIGLFQRTYHRFVIPLLPFLAVFAAYGLARWSSLLGTRGRRLVAVGALLSLALPTWATARLAWLRSRDDTLELAARWLAQQDPQELGTVWIEPRMDLPLACTTESLQRTTFPSLWRTYQLELAPQELPPLRLSMLHVTPTSAPGFDLERLERDPPGFLDALGPGHYVADASCETEMSVADSLHAALRSRTRLVQRCAPEADGPTAGWGLDDEDILRSGQPHVLLRLLRAEALGPVVEIRRLEPQRVAER